MSEVKAVQFIIPAHPGPHQIEEMLAMCSNQIVSLADILTNYNLMWQSKAPLMSGHWLKTLSQHMTQIKGGGC